MHIKKEKIFGGDWMVQIWDLFFTHAQNLSIIVSVVLKHGMSQNEPKW